MLNNHVSTILLLILIAIGCYFLYSTEYYTNNKIENFINDPFGIDNANSLSRFTDKNSQNSQPPKISLESNKTVTFANGSSQEIVLPDDASPTNFIPVMDNTTSTFDFTPNDESVNTNGVDLTNAYASPLPKGTNADVIDFKKGNTDNYDAKDFLPKEINDEWFETDFSLAKYQLNDDKLINTERYIIGINTVGQSLKNASYDIRGTIPNPKFAVSPWGMSTYEPDFNLKSLC